LNRMPSCFGSANTDRPNGLPCKLRRSTGIVAIGPPRYGSATSLANLSLLFSYQSQLRC
jgi:hypothetical protein